MTSLGPNPGNASLLMTTKEPAIVEVKGVTAPSPAIEMEEARSLVIAEVDQETANVANEAFLSFALSLRKSTTTDINSAREPSRRLRRSSTSGILKREDAEIQSLECRRKDRMRLPSFRSLGISTSDPEYFPHYRNSNRPGRSAHLDPETRTQNSHSLSSTRIHQPHFGSAPLLTPPEDVYSIKWNNAILHHTQPSPQQGKQIIMSSDLSQTILSTSTADSGSTSAGDSLGSSEESTEDSVTPTAHQPGLGVGRDDQGMWLDEGISATGTFSSSVSIAIFVDHV